MNTFVKNKTIKKLVIALVVLILFSFCYPKNVNAWILDDLPAGIAKLLFTIEKGVLKFLNDVFSERPATEGEVTEIGPDGGTYQPIELSVSLTPENIIKGRFILFDANIFKEVTDGDYYDLQVDDNGNPTGTVANGRIALRKIISGWYYALRNFAIVALLSVLVYVGIRMITSTIAQDKAKYKYMFKDWLVAICLLIAMHYIMIGILNISTEIINAIGSGSGPDMLSNVVRDISGVLSEGGQTNEWKYTNPNGNVITISDAFAKMFVLAGIIGYTFIFAVKYLKREFTIIFLILLGPISCITYPIDKIADGKAQAFNKWFSEFLYQVIIQPFHLLLYIVLVGSAAELAEANVIYALVCFAILIPSEKFIREMFGFKDRLGSPLGAMAGGALAAKALSSLLGGGKGSGASGKGDSGNVNSQGELPPKTVDKKELNGEGDNLSAEENTEAQISQKDNPALEAGEDNPENPGLGEGIDNTALAAGVGAAVGAEAAENANNPNEETEADRAQGLAEQERKGSSFWNSIASTHNRRAALKWGSTNMGRRWVNRGKKLLGKTGRIALRTAGVGAGALAGGAVGMMFGKGAAGAGAGMVLGSKLSGKVISGARGIANTAGDYITGIRGDSGREAKVLQAFKADKSQIEKARLSFKSRPGNEGKEPSWKELDQEITDRFELSRYGLEDAQIDRAVGEYQVSRSSFVKNGMSIEVAQGKALNETAYAAKLANDYSKKDFRTEKTMTDAVNTIARTFQAQGVSEAVARQNATRYLEKAAKIKGSDIALQGVTRTIDVQVPASQLAGSLGIEHASMSATQVERMNKIQVRLHSQGYSSGQISQIASSCRGGSTTEVLDRFEVAIDYLNDETVIDQAKMIIEEGNGGNIATPDQTRGAAVEIAGIMLTSRGTKSAAQAGNARRNERVLKTRSEEQMARDFEYKNKGRFNNQAHMETQKRDLINQLVAEGHSSSNAAKVAERIMLVASENAGESLPEGW